MNEVIIWAQFAGAWLLVAGPLYQGSVELDELDVDREGIEGIKSSALGAAPGRPSPWWWLLPPVMYVLHRRWSRQFRRVTMAQLTETQLEQITTFRNKATGWYTVAIGALLLAAGESWQVTRHYNWPGWVFWLLMAVTLGACLLNTAVRMISDHHARSRGGATSMPRPAPEQG